MVIDMMMRDIEFLGPEPLGYELPDHSGIYLVCTESSGGIRILGVYGADDMRKDILENPFSKDWKGYEDNCGLFVYWSEELPYDTVQTKVWDIISTRPYPVPCVKRLEDDW